MSKAVFTYGPCWAERDGDALTGELSYRRDGKKAAKRTWRAFDTALAGWFAAASDGDRIEVIVGVDGDGQAVAVRMARPPVLTLPAPDSHRLAEVARLGGKPNPYTFIPTPPRTGLPPGLDSGPPAPHGVIDPQTQWSGWLTLRLVTTTPMLLPDPAAAETDQDQHPTYPVREGQDGQPLLHGASVKGALRSAYEAITNSRYAVFKGHDRRLAYRRPAGGQKQPIEPARVEADGNGGLRFQLCDAYPVRLYGPTGRKAQAVGRARHKITTTGGLDWAKLHGAWVTCTLTTRKVVDKIALADDERSLGSQGGQRARGWLSVTGHTIENKTSERVLVPKIKNTIIVEKGHHAIWHAVLASYRDAAEQRDNGGEPADQAPQPSWHLSANGKVPDRLADGDLVYLERDAGVITAILPVYIGRLPYDVAPAELLDQTLHPAPSLDELSPADRLFGWAPPQAAKGRAAASGYRGRLRIASVRCETEDWLTSFEEPVRLAPLSTPKPTQFRFYASPDQQGSPMRPKAQKSEGYREGGGLRGRKAYWYPSQAGDDYWKPGAGEIGGQFREWQEPPGAAPSQTSSHRGWVRKGAEFTVRLFIDAVPAPELGPLIWLATQPGCPLRLGAGKPLGFGAVTITVNWNATELRTANALAGCWTSLTRPAPCDTEQIRALATNFEQQADASPALAPALAAYRVVASGLEEPAAYPRTGHQPEAETYRWFTANEKITDHNPHHGIALPHALEKNQNLPYITPDDT